MHTSAFLSKRAQSGEFTRVVAFGSSNTERRIAGMHWFDCFELAYRTTFGQQVVCINSGRGGDTTSDLLDRMERDCLAYQPHIAFVTIGGNDSNPERGISVAAFQDNLCQIIRRIEACGCRPVLQTYYGLDLAEMPPLHVTAFAQMMQVVRDLSSQTDCMLIDHLARWERLRKAYYEIFQELMLDPMHVNNTGNLVLGLDVVRAFSMKLSNDPYLSEARTTQALLDKLAAGEQEEGACR